MVGFRLLRNNNKIRVVDDLNTAPDGYQIKLWHVFAAFFIEFSFRRANVGSSGADVYNVVGKAREMGQKLPKKEPFAISSTVCNSTKDYRVSVTFVYSIYLIDFDDFK